MIDFGLRGKKGRFLPVNKTKPNGAAQQNVTQNTKAQAPAPKLRDRQGNFLNWGNVQQQNKDFDAKKNMAQVANDAVKAEQQRRNAETKARLLAQRNQRLSSGDVGPSAGFTKLIKTETQIKDGTYKQPGSGFSGKYFAGALSAVADKGKNAYGAVTGFAKDKYAQHQENSLLRKQKKVEDARLKELREGPKESSSEGSSGLSVLVVFAIIIHIVDFYSGFDRTGIGIGTIKVIPQYHVIVVYILLAIFGSTIVFKDKGSKTSFIGAILLAIFFPALIVNFKDSIQLPWLDSLTTVALAFPVLVLYLMRKFPNNTFVFKSTRWYFFVWMLIAMVLFVSSSTFTDVTTGTSVQLKNPMQRVIYFFSGVGTSLNTVYTNTIKSVQKGIAQATGQQYQGEEESARGIMLSDFKSLEQTYYTDSRIFMEAKIKAQNIKEVVIVKTVCFIPDEGNYMGKAYPATLSMVNDDENTIDCEFPAMKAGDYTAKMVSTFSFAQDSDIEYYFVDSNTDPKLYEKLKIPTSIIARYSGGPVELGLPALHQPLRLSLDPNEKDVGNYPFGVSFTNKWSQGKVVKGTQYTLDVPYGVVLDTCSRKQKEGSPVQVGDRMKYYFDIYSNNAQESFDSITCRMKVTNPYVFLGGQLSTHGTFSARAEYDYSVEQISYIHVEDTTYKKTT